MDSQADDIVVRVEHVSKTFRIHSERNQYLKSAILRGRRSKYEEFWALRDVSFEVSKGEAFGIIGHNGSGKSTMLKCLTGILRPDQGQCSVVGSVSALLELGAGFHPELSGRENVYLNAAILGMPRKEISRRFDEIVEFAGIAQFIDTPVKNYSSGMYVRLGFAIAINVDPDVLIIDEILSVGDAEFQARCRDKIADFRDRGKTIILVSHSLSDVVSMCNRAIWLDHGEMRRIGEPGSLVDEYTGIAREGRKVDLTDATRWGSGEVRVTRIEMLGADLQPIDFARTGEPVTFRMHYSAYKPIANAIFGIEIHLQNGMEVTGTNGRRHGRSIPMIEGDGFVDFHIPRLPLLQGTYDFSSDINDWSEMRLMDHWQKPLRFDVLPNHPIDAGGIVSFFGEFKHEGVTTRPTTDTH